MEGPSLFLAAEQLQPLVGEKIEQIGGNTKLQKERLLEKTILSIFSYGKYLFFQLDAFALRVHFLLWGSFEATIRSKKVTGDYPKKVPVPRLSLELKSGHVELYNCSLVFIEDSHAKRLCDFSIDTMSDTWDGNKALVKMHAHPDTEIADVLLDQTIFMGVGNIIKNEVLLLAKVLPTRKVDEISRAKLEEIVQLVRRYVFQFYEWRKNFELRKHYQIYRQGLCKQCGSKVIRKKTGTRNRISYFCEICQK